MEGSVSRTQQKDLGRGQELGSAGCSAGRAPRKHSLSSGFRLPAGLLGASLPMVYKTAAITFMPSSTAPLLGFRVNTTREMAMGPTSVDRRVQLCSCGKILLGALLEQSVWPEPV